MFQATRKRQLHHERGFTIIELCIVIAVLVILIILVATTYGGIQEKNRNLTRQTNLEAIHQQLEEYFNNPKNGHYPSRSDMDNSSWLAKNMPKLNPDLLVDPSSPTHSEKLVASPTFGAYAYEPTQINGTSSCESNDATCAEYTLIATYEGSVNGEKELVIHSIN
jgi:prepilin-type N-terminal cleavage/methylation domain-containing protein